MWKIFGVEQEKNDAANGKKTHGYAYPEQHEPDITVFFKHGLNVVYFAVNKAKITTFTGKFKVYYGCS